MRYNLPYDIHKSYNHRNEEELIDFIESIMENNHVPGLSVAVIKDKIRLNFENS